MPRPIYLDHNATTPAFDEVVEAMRACWSQPILNPASQHAFGRAARSTLENARDHIAQLLGSNTTGPTPDRVIFTSGGTEANNLAIQGIAGGSNSHQRADFQLLPTPDSQHVIISAIEHPSITTLVDRLVQTDYKVDRLGVDSNGVIRVDDLRRLIRPETRLVAAMLANNETGVIQPIAEMAAICADYDVPLHTDATQAIGKLPVSFSDLGVATMTIAAHKLGGPIGIGALLVRGDVQLVPQLHGGFQQAGLRPGSEAVPLVVGMRTALELWETNRAKWLRDIRAIRDEFERLITSEPTEGGRSLATFRPVVIGRNAERLPTTSNIAFVGLDRQQLFLALDQVGIACSTGSACASGSSEASPVHVAMGCEPAVISSALRFSFGAQTTADDVTEAACRILSICNDLGRKNTRRFSP